MINDFFGIIPARAGSKGIPQKNLVDIAGRVMIEYTIMAAQESNLLSSFIISTDSPQIAEFSKSLGCEVPFIRPVDLAQDDSTTISVIIHSLEWLKSKEGRYPSNVVLLQPTTPFRNGNDIDKCIEFYTANNCNSLASVVEPHQHPLDMCYFENGKFNRIKINKRNALDKGRQKYPKVWFIDGGVYIRDVKKLFKSSEILCEDTKVVELDRSHGIDIDDYYTLQLARLLAEKNKENDN